MTSDEIKLSPTAETIRRDLELRLSRRPVGATIGLEPPGDPEAASDEQGPVYGNLGPAIGNIIPPEGSYRCRGWASGDAGWLSGKDPQDADRCPTVLARPGFCDRCGVALERAQIIAEQERIRERGARFAEKSIPEFFLWAKPKAPEFEKYVHNWPRVRGHAGGWLSDVFSDRRVGSGVCCFRGAGGVGKTSAAIGVFRAAIAGSYKLAASAEFFFARDLIVPLYGAPQKEVAQHYEIVERAKASSLAVFDDMGKDVENGRRSVMGLVIERRHAIGLPTVITTSLGHGCGVDEAYNAMERAYDDQLARRVLLGGCLIEM